MASIFSADSTFVREIHTLLLAPIPPFPVKPDARSRSNQSIFSSWFVLLLHPINNSIQLQRRVPWWGKQSCSGWLWKTGFTQPQVHLSPLGWWQIFPGEKLQQTSYPHFSEYRFRQARQDIRTYEARQADCRLQCVGEPAEWPPNTEALASQECVLVRPTLITQLWWLSHNRQNVLSTHAHTNNLGGHIKSSQEQKSFR